MEFTMRGKLLFVTGALAGYVLGARAGRQRYEQIKSAANTLWNTKPVQRRVSEVRDFALEAVGDAPVAVFDTVKKLVGSATAKRNGSARISSPTVVSTEQATAPERAFGSD
jgi:hypothetical protein